MVLAHATRHRWTIQEFERLYELGMLPQHRVELMDGEIITMPPMQTAHGVALTQGNNLLADLFGDTHYVRVQAPFDVPEYFQPEPDFLLIAKKDFDKRSHPTTSDLIIEVADSSLAYDRNEKGSLYALAGVPEYWIVNVVNHTVEVRREPSVDRRRRYGYGYRELSHFQESESVAPLFRPDRAVPVSSWF